MATATISHNPTKTVEEFKLNYHIDNQSIINQITGINYSNHWYTQNRPVVSYYQNPETRKFFLVAQQEGNPEILGYITSRPHQEYDFSPDGDYLTYMAVAQGSQNKGIATSMLQSLVEKTQATGVRHLSGDYRGNKENLHRLYSNFKDKSLGIVTEYQEYPNHGTYLNGDPKVAFIYTLKIET